MKVALVTRAVYPLHGYGGLERHVYDLARALAERDVEVTLITQPPTQGREPLALPERGFRHATQRKSLYP